MSLITRVTHEIARRLVDPQQYVVSQRCAESNRRAAVYLTFDDGPHPDRTSRILDHFAENGGHATFFVIGRNARRHPQIVRRILEDGHSIGCHTWSHWSARRSSAGDYIEDVYRGRDMIQQITGRPTSLFRPPYGELTPLTLHSLVIDGFRIVQWSRDTRDFQQPSVCDLQQCFDRQPLRDGDIVLMHDDSAVTSYALDNCLRTWAPNADFRAIPMSSGQLAPLALDIPSNTNSDRRQSPLAVVGPAGLTEDRGV